MKYHISFLILFAHFPNLVFTTKPKTTIIASKLATDNDVNALKPIAPDEILPLIFIQPPFSKYLRPPKSLEVLAVRKGQIMPETEFYSNRQDKQFFFCPSDKFYITCLMPQVFKKTEPLQCDKVPEPVLTSLYEHDRCGPDYIGTMFKFVYKICPPPVKEDYDYYTRELLIYEFCFDRKNEKVLYSRHEILSPLLLDEPLLVHERNVNFNEVENIDGVTDIKDHSLFIQKLYRGRSRIVDEKLLELPYDFQQLVPPEHMAFALWKKPTLNYFNKEFQHKSLIKLWNEINNLVLIDATKMQFHVPYTIHTGIFDKCEKLSTWDKSQFSTMWIQMITVNFTPPRRTGIAIIMDNFIHRVPGGTCEQDVASGDAGKDPLKGWFCEDLCDEKIRSKFNEIGGRVNCCPISEEIQKLFGTDLRIDGLLRIADLIQP